MSERRFAETERRIVAAYLGKPFAVDISERDRANAKIRLKIRARRANQSLFLPKRQSALSLSLSR